MKNFRYTFFFLLCFSLVTAARAGSVPAAHQSSDQYDQEAPVLQEILAHSSEEAALMAAETHAEAAHIVAESAPEKRSTAPVSSTDMNKSEQKTARKALRKELKTMRKSAKKNQRPQGEYAEEIICVIFAILIPPLGVFLHEGIGTNFWIDLILTLLFFFPGLIFALLVVLVF